MAARSHRSAADKLRAKELAMIHIAKQQLGMDEETYRAMLHTQARVSSSKELDSYGRNKVLLHLKQCGFKATGSLNAGAPHNLKQRPLLKKIHALLADAKRPWSYADGMAQKMFTVERVAFCGDDQLYRIVAALNYDKARRQGKQA